MSNPTSNFNWQMPTNTDLVTDLPADFEVFGQAVDTSLADLKGGTTGQILSKATNTDMDFTWITNDVGDITAVTAGTGISGGGTSGAVTITNSMATEITAKGDLIVGTGSATFDNLAAGANGSTLVADSTTTTGLAYSPSGLTQPIINGAFDIAQRGTTTGTMATTYIVDRWAASTSSGVGTQAQVAGLTVGTEVFRYAWKFTALGSYTFMQMGTQIEFANCYQLQNQEVTISFYAQANNTNSASTALIVRTRTGATVDANILFSGTNSPTSQTITTTATRYSITKTLPATFGALSLEFGTTATGAAGDGFTITGVQIDKGSVALPFRRAGGTIQGELAACQRYYFRLTGTSTYGMSPIAGIGNSTTVASLTLPTKVTMRIAPTSVDWSGVKVSDDTTATTVTALTVNATNTNPDSVYFTATVASGLTQYRPYMLNLPNATTNYIGWSAEL